MFLVSLDPVIGSLNAGNSFRISVPFQGNNPLKTRLQKHLMRIGDIEDSEL